MTDHKVINITDVITHIIYEIIHKSPSFSHIDINRILVCIASNKRGSRGGIYGKLLPLKFENGSEVLNYRGKFYTIPEVTLNGHRQLYFIYFYMSKFFDLPAKTKLKVIFHELYHINPEFNGDIRRMAKVKAAHGHSRKHFDSLYKNEYDAFYKYISETQYIKFLKMDSRSLYKNFNKVIGRRMKNPKPVAVKN